MASYLKQFAEQMVQTQKAVNEVARTLNVSQEFAERICLAAPGLTVVQLIQVFEKAQAKRHDAAKDFFNWLLQFEKEHKPVSRPKTAAQQVDSLTSAPVSTTVSLNPLAVSSSLAELSPVLRSIVLDLFKLGYQLEGAMMATPGGHQVITLVNSAGQKAKIAHHHTGSLSIVAQDQVDEHLIHTMTRNQQHHVFMFVPEAEVLAQPKVTQSNNVTKLSVSKTLCERFMQETQMGGVSKLLDLFYNHIVVNRHATYEDHKTVNPTYALLVQSMLAAFDQRAAQKNNIELAR